MSETTVADKNAIPDFLTSEGQLGMLIRNYDWASTPLGPIHSWSQSLKTTVNLMLHSKNPIWVGWGPENTFLYNDQYIDVLGDEKHKWALGKPAGEVWQEIWEYAGPLADKVYNLAEATYGADVQLFMKRGDFLEEKYFSFSYSPVFDESGKVGGLFCPNFDTTDKILSARRNRTLSELAARSLIEKSIATACSSAAETMAKNDKDIPFAVFYMMNDNGDAAEILQSTGVADGVEDIFPNYINLADSESAKLHPILTEVLTTGTQSVNTLIENSALPTGPAGQRVTHAISLPLTLSANNIVGMLICGINPTRRLDDDYRTFFEMAASQVSAAIQNATAFENERKRLDELAKIDKAKTAFFSNISHEFRTPLTLMLGPLEDLLDNYSLPFNEKQIIQTTHRNAMRLLKLVNTLLDFSLMESGRMKARFVPTELGTFTANLAGNFRSVIERGGMEFTVNTENIPQAFIDRQMWEKIVFNLLSNAFKYTLKGTVSLQLVKQGNTAVLTVSDTGVGIPEKEMPNMFTRFHRVQNSDGRSFEGSGIGLSMIREFVIEHGGNITVHSEEGKGSTFTVTLPLGREHLPEEQIMDFETTAEDVLSGQHIREADLMLQDATDNSIEVMHERVSAKTDTVLIVDDNADMRRHLSSIIEKHYNVLTAQHGKEALDLVQHNDVSLIVSDIMMPVMDGIELLKQVKSMPQLAMVPIILLTARAGEESRIEGYETGADDYLVKPFSAKELEARIRSQIRISKTRGHIRNELKNLFMQAPMAICILRGEDFVVEMANDNIMKLWGKDNDAMMNKPLFEGLPEARLQGFDKLLEQVYHTGKEYIDEEAHFYTIDENGREDHLYIKFIYQPLHEEDGTISGIIVLAHDVTQQVIARKKAEDSEARFRSLIVQAPMGISILKGEDLVLEMANDAYLKIRGKKRDEIIGKPIGDALPEMKGTQVEENLKEVVRSGITTTYTDMPAEIIINGEKQTRYFNSVYQPLFENDETVGVIAIVTEVTEQYHIKKLQEKNEKDLRLILETIPHIAFRANPEGNVTYFNDKYFEYTGYAFDDVKGEGWHKVIHPDMLQQVSAFWADCLKTGDDCTDTFLLRRADGTYRWHMSRTVALRDELGNITQWVGTLTDIHEQKVFAEKLEAMVDDRTEKLNHANHILAEKNIQLEQSNKELESFNYIASHDLQEPLRKIRTFINMIKDKGREGNSDLYFSKIDSSAERMSQLINAVLTYSRLSSAIAEFEATDLNAILEQVLIDFELIIYEKDAEVEHEELPVIKAIPLQMSQLFSNLISNSLKYSSDKPVIKISAKEIRGYDIAQYKGDNIAEPFVELRFSDNGIGFEKQYSEQIFKLFQRLHGKTEYSGTGIGLSICKKIVDQHSGYISAESVPGQGATFIVQLPVGG